MQYWSRLLLFGGAVISLRNVHLNDVRGYAAVVAAAGHGTLNLEPDGFHSVRQRNSMNISILTWLRFHDTHLLFVVRIPSLRYSPGRSSCLATAQRINPRMTRMGTDKISKYPRDPRNPWSKQSPGYLHAALSYRSAQRRRTFD